MSNGTDFNWKNIAQSVSQEILDDAYSKTSNIISIFSSVKGILIPRGNKKQSRIVKKMIEVESRDGAFFKVVSDFTAFRIECEVPEIEDIINSIIDITLNEQQGTVWKKGNHRNGSRYVDITQYLYVYIPSIGYITEFQVGHKLSAYTFTNDSALRDDPKCGLDDIWKGGVYNTLKERILEDANRSIIEKAEKKPYKWELQKYNLYCLIDDVYEHKPPKELSEILEQITEKRFD
jgi:hypothetical protein